MRKKHLLVLVVAMLGVLVAAAAAGAHRGPLHKNKATLLAHGLQGSVGATIGPDGALYVAEAGTGPGHAGRITRVDPSNGKTTTVASGLPARVIPLGGAIDVAFVGSAMYVLVTAVGPDVG